MAENSAEKGFQGLSEKCCEKSGMKLASNKAAYSAPYEDK